MFSALALLLAFPQEPRVDPQKVEQAIQRGARFLLAQAKRGIDPDPHFQGKISREELVLLTLVHAGTDTKQEEFQLLLRRAETKGLAHVYPVSLLAMALESVDRRRYQPRLAQCAQFLVDNQCTNGQWSYGRSVRLPTITPASRSGQKTGSTEALPIVTIARRGRGPSTGDNSNSQYAALGLRACMDASVRLPPDTLADAERWWERAQHGDGGWGYDMQEFLADGKDSYGSMTAGAVASLVIWKHCQKKDYAAAPSVKRGLEWLAKHFSVARNPGVPPSFLGMANPRRWHTYWLYAAERAGMLYGTEAFGTHEWYAEGARHLLDAQREDGRWSADAKDSEDGVVDTCFAILFLRRSTKPVKDVASVDTTKK